MTTELCNLMKQHGSDKGADWHNYTQIYSAFFSNARDKVSNLFELGIGSVNPGISSHMKNIYKPGGSLRAWRDYFHNADIFAADIDKDILESEDRITKFYVDQTNKEVIENMWASPELANKQFDIIIDDGLHTFKANKIFFENSYHKLDDSGIFIIEDIPNAELDYFRNQLAAEARDLEFSTRLLQLKHVSNKTDNNIMVITKNQNYIDIIDSLSQEFFI